MATKDYIGLEMPSILGMGAVGPTLAILTASLYQALSSAIDNPPRSAYPVIMLSLAFLLAIFPAAQAKYPRWQKLFLWPLAAIVIFSAAWGTNQGLSVSEEAVGDKVSLIAIPSFAGNAYAGDVFADVDVTVTNKAGTCYTNKVDFSKLDESSKKQIPSDLVSYLPPHVWGLSWENGSALLKDGKGKWWWYKPKPPLPPPPPPTASKEPTLKGGFFKRF